ncbi:MAG: response regulator transcription factor [Acidimicrobiales bacterium]
MPPRAVPLDADALSNRQIAMQLYLSERTVENQVSSALRKLDLPSRAALAAWHVRCHTWR